MRAMKQTRIGILREIGIACAMVAAAPLVGAHAPSTAPVAPSPTNPPAADPAAEHNADQISYLFGLTFGEQMHGVGIGDQVTIDAIARGLKDGLQGKRSTPADRQQVQDFVHSVIETMVARNQEAAKDFLARNGREKGVTTMPFVRRRRRRDTRLSRRALAPSSSRTSG